MSDVAIKYALVTGCSKGLGKALVHQLLGSGYTVFPLVRKSSDVEELKVKVSERCHPIHADVSLDNCIDVIRTSISQNGGRIDLLINNAGIPGVEPHLESTSANELESLFSVHCLGVLRVSQACLPFFGKAPTPLILNISSRLGSLTKMSRREFPEGEFSYSYRVAKAAQNMLTLCMSQDLIKNNIRVHAVHPGRMKTDSAAANANLEPAEVARRLVNWVEFNESEATGLFFEPDGAELPW